MTMFKVNLSTKKRQITVSPKLPFTCKSDIFYISSLAIIIFEAMFNSFLLAEHSAKLFGQLMASVGLMQVSLSVSKVNEYKNKFN